MKLLSFFSQLWVWCLSLFGGGQQGDQNTTPSISSDNSSPSLIDKIVLKHLQDISGNEINFVSRHRDYYQNLSLRHGAPNFKLHFHFMSGAAVYLPDLQKNILFERIFYSLDPGRGHRTIVDKSFVIYTPWSTDWSVPLASPKLLPVNETAGSIYIDDNSNKTRCMEGPEDPRVIYDEVKDEVHANFNMLTHNDDRQMFGKSFKFVSDNDDVSFASATDSVSPSLSSSSQLTSDDISVIEASHLTQFQHAKGYRAGTEKNWVPILIQGELHYVYSLSPLRILKCSEPENSDSEGSSTSESDNIKDKVTDHRKICTVQFKGESVHSGSQTGALRSGTNWIEFSPGVFFSFARTRFMHKKCDYGLYRPHLLVLRFEIDTKAGGAYTKPRIIYASEPITRFDDEIFNLYVKRGFASGSKCDDRAVLTPGSITRWTGMDGGDVADVIISVNDDINVLLKLEGLGAIVQAALDSEPNLKKSRFLARKNAITSKAEREMKKFIEKSFAKVFKNDDDNDDGDD